MTIKNTINVAKAIKSPIINMHLNPGVYFTLPDKKVYLNEVFADEYTMSILKFRDLCVKEIGDDNIAISIENCSGYLPFMKKSIKTLLAFDKFSLTFDIGHDYHANIKDKDFIFQNLTKLRHMHIHDAINNSYHLTLGSGEINLNEYLDLAAKNNISCVIETKTVTSLIDSVNYINNLE